MCRFWVPLSVGVLVRKRRLTIWFIIWNCFLGCCGTVQKMTGQNLKYDCGILVLKMMELWDGDKKFDGNSMHHYTN
ncbi:hypothetical protein DEO72_LG3g1891 [Vigna unguiculata]|uniref:Ulp1 protease family n=1 Tax=Vigna unguiculata TaxID=3917 RepID=A0A4D6LFL3_VIGUN|nr:hypothetical protein DEO72_LG3g1891 [Vigna unguiculata]